MSTINGVRVLVLGGPEEQEIYDYAMKELANDNINGNGCKNSIGEYMSFVSKCDTIVSATTFGLIVADIVFRAVIDCLENNFEDPLRFVKINIIKASP